MGGTFWHIQERPCLSTVRGHRKVVRTRDWVERVNSSVKQVNKYKEL